MISICLRSREARDSYTADKEEIGAFFGKQIFAVLWTWDLFPFLGPLNFFTASGGGGGISGITVGRKQNLASGRASVSL